ncbi:sensor histidine kinase [Allokutzneria oryzae]|uniref:histidine kinase n=1 Tax=Allokutzneria oryzae TaxID=1378989 RepID=A0ABV5ZSF6_9PSEU
MSSPFVMWPWRALCYLCSTLPVAVVWLLSLLPLGPFAGVPLRAVERRRLRLFDPTVTPEPRARHTLRELVAARSTWVALLYGLVLLPLGTIDLTLAVLCVAVPLTMLGLPLWKQFGAELDAVAGIDTTTVMGTLLVVLFGALSCVVGAALVSAAAWGRAAFARAVLVGPRERELGEQLVRLRSSRLRLVDAFELERRRIERDLHDGAQQRLLSLIMTLGLLRLEVPERSRGLADKAQDEARAALEELRELVRGIHPAVLTDSGLVAALHELGDRCPVRVDVVADAVDRLPETIESTAYFCVSEALTNLVRHSGADRARVELRQRGNKVLITVWDNGKGEASELTAIADRLSTVDGELAVLSPAGGPTELRMQLPCAW